MIVFKVALRNLLRKLRRTLLVGGLIAAVMAILVLGNAVFERSSEGMKASFTRSLTGDLVVAQRAEEAFSLFGNETPIVADYAVTPVIPLYAQVDQVVASQPAVAARASLVTSAGLLQVGSAEVKAVFFGVSPEGYAVACDALVFDDPLPPRDSRFVILNSRQRLDLERMLGRPLARGDPITVTLGSVGSFRIRRVPYAGSFDYPAPSDALDKVALVDVVTARALNGYGLGYVNATSRSAQAGGGSIPEGKPGRSAASIDELFSSAEDLRAPGEDSLDPMAVESLLADRKGESDSLVLGETGEWNFILLRLHPGADPAVVRASLVRSFADQGWDLKVMDWRDAAGMAAQGLVALQLVFGAGMAIIAVGALIMLMNGIVITVLERSGEIGTMRALGATRRFIRRLFAIETLAIVIAASLAGLALGVGISLIVSRGGIVLSNPSLASLFGGNILRPRVGALSVLVHLAGAGAVGSLAWVYPVRLALRIQPLQAMSGK
jgi:putative ABC transport system permease protein